VAARPPAARKHPGRTRSQPAQPSAAHTPTSAVDPAALTALPEPTRAQALARFRLLRPHLEDGVPLARLARAEGIALRTAQRWLARYRNGGLVGLARQPRSDRGRRRLPDDLVTLIEGLALRRPALSVTAIWRLAGEIAADQGWPTPSYSRVYAIVACLDPALVTLARDGAKRYREVFDLVRRRTAERPNAIWQADHTQLDLTILDPAGQPARPWLTIVLDDYSRAIAGYAVFLEAPSAMQTALAMRQAIWRKPDAGWQVCGIPEVFYTDHGSDFTSAHLEQVAADLKMRLVFSTAGQPRGRGKIERLFGSVNQLLLATLPGYTPAGTPATPPRLSLADLDQALRTFIVRDYHTRVHSETRQPPLVRWEAGGFLPRLPERLADLDLLLLTVAKPRMVHPDGICWPTFVVSMSAPLLVSACGCGKPRRVVWGGAWWSRCRLGAHSVVTSVTAVRADDSSTMVLLAVNAASRAWTARLLTARG
jgi:putative transposase